MRLYLVRHGQPLPKEEDPERSLSARGREEVEGIAQLLGQSGVQVARIAHSGKTRARETAEILATRIAGGGQVETAVGLSPMDPVEPVVDEAAGWEEDVMLVGHLPFMGRLVSLLVSGEEEAEVAAFQPGAVVCLGRIGEDAWIVEWMITPEIVPG
jgi:phosphohistidine phosphatase